MKAACVIGQKIIYFYALDFTFGFHLRGEINSFSLLFLRVVFSIETQPLRQQNQFLNFYEDMSLVTEISAIILIQLWCLVKQLKKQASLKLLPGITKEIDTFPRKFFVPVQGHYV